MSLGKKCSNNDFDMELTLELLTYIYQLFTNDLDLIAGDISTIYGHGNITSSQHVDCYDGKYIPVGC